MQLSVRAPLSPRPTVGAGPLSWQPVASLDQRQRDFDRTVASRWSSNPAFQRYRPARGSTANTSTLLTSIPAAPLAISAHDSQAVRRRPATSISARAKLSVRRPAANLPTYPRPCNIVPESPPPCLEPRYVLMPDGLLSEPSSR